MPATAAAVVVAIPLDNDSERFHWNKNVTKYKKIDKYAYEFKTKKKIRQLFFIINSLLTQSNKFLWMNRVVVEMCGNTVKHPPRTDISNTLQCPPAPPSPMITNIYYHSVLYKCHEKGTYARHYSTI
jgi:hypothetical protein